MTSFTSLLSQVRACTLCSEHLPDGVNPVLQIHPDARVLIAGQAPGRKVHASGIPFDDASGDRLRKWMGVSKETFYDPTKIAILPMAFCYPGTGKSGDLPPRSECAVEWRDKLLEQLSHIQVTLAVGKYAQNYHIKKNHIKKHQTNARNLSLTETVRNWRGHLPDIIPLPHPSPRNNIWLKRNPWFEAELLPILRQRVSKVLSESSS